MLTKISKANPTSVLPNTASVFTEGCQKAVEIKGHQTSDSFPKCYSFCSVCQRPLRSFAFHT